MCTVCGMRKEGIGSIRLFDCFILCACAFSCHVFSLFLLLFLFFETIDLISLMIATNLHFPRAYVVVFVCGCGF